MQFWTKLYFAPSSPALNFYNVFDKLDNALDQAYHPELKKSFPEPDTMQVAGILQGRIIARWFDNLSKTETCLSMSPGGIG
jgi:hypothetical protein